MRWKIQLMVAVLLCALIAFGSSYGAEDAGSLLKRADELLGLKQYEQAEQIYLAIVQQGSQFAFAEQRQLAILYISMSPPQEIKAEAAVEKLLTAFAEQPTLAREISRVGDAYLKAGKYDKTLQLYQYILEKWAGTQNVLWAKAGLAKLDIATGNDAAGQAKIESFVADFNDHPELCEVLFEVGGEYYDRAFRCENLGLTERVGDSLKKAIVVWGRIINQTYERGLCVTQARYFTGICHERLGEHTKAIECYSKVVSEQPDFEYAWNAQFLIGRNLMRLWQMGVVAKSEVDTQIRAVYEQLIERYPKCPAAAAAKDWLDSHRDLD